MERAKALGDAHEQRYLRELRVDRRVVGVERPREVSRAAYEQAADATLLALASDADVVYQAAFFDGRFHGFADFLVREPAGWTVLDTKLARTPRSRRCCSSRRTPTSSAPRASRPRRARLVLGDGAAHDTALPTCSRSTATAAPGWSAARRPPGPRRRGLGRRALPRLRSLRRVRAEVEATRDVLLVAGMRHPADRLRAAGVTTIEQLAASAAPVRGHGAVHRWTGCASRRRCSPARTPTPGDAVTAASRRRRDARRAARARARRHLLRLRGRPALGRERCPARLGPGVPVRRGRGRQRSDVPAVLGPRPRRRSSRRCVDFLDYVAERRAAHPGMHIYHYAPYERTALLRLAGRHGVGEDAVDDLLRDGVLVDLYADGARGRPGVAAVLLAQEARAALHGRRAARRRGVDNARRLDRRVRRRRARCADARRRPTRPARALDADRATTTSTTASPRCGCATGCSTGGRARVSVRRPS